MGRKRQLDETSHIPRLAQQQLETFSSTNQSWSEWENMRKLHYTWLSNKRSWVASNHQPSHAHCLTALPRVLMKRYTASEQYCSTLCWNSIHMHEGLYVLQSYKFLFDTSWRGLSKLLALRATITNIDMLSNHVKWFRSFYSQGCIFWVPTPFKQRIKIQAPFIRKVEAFVCNTLNFNGFYPQNRFINVCPFHLSG